MTINRDKSQDRAKTRDKILNGPHHPYVSGANWLGHGARRDKVGGAKIDYLLLDGATEAQLQKARPTFREHFEHLQKDHGLLVTEYERGTFRFDREDLGISDTRNEHESRELIPSRSSGIPRQPDPLLRQQIEYTAVEMTTQRFTEEGYTVNSVEKDNCGWDLIAIRGREMLRLEVKGLSGCELCVELTPNEYARMRDFRDSYQLCVVTNALTKPRLTTFALSHETKRWQDQEARPLLVQEIVAARCRAAGS